MGRFIRVLLVYSCQAPKVTAKVDTRAVAKELGYPAVTARRALEDLTGHGVVECESMGQGTASKWSLSYWTQKRWAEIQ